MIKMYRECKEWFGYTYYSIEVEELEFNGMGKPVSCIRKTKKPSARQDNRSVTDALLSITVLQPEDEQQILIKPGGMVDVAIRELGAEIVDVELIEERVFNDILTNPV
jgi:hypothetical protein